MKNAVTFTLEKSKSKHIHPYFRYLGSTIAIFISATTFVLVMLVKTRVRETLVVPSLWRRIKGDIIIQ